MRRLLVIVGVFVGVGVVLRAGSAAQSPAPLMGGGCTLTFPTPLYIPVTGTISGVVIDDSCDYVYLTNTSLNRVEVFSLQTLSLQTPIQVGSQPVGIDLTPDGLLMYVANSGGENISVVDVAQRVELRKISVPPKQFGSDKPYSIAIANNGRAIFSTTFSGSGFGARMMDLVLATDQVSHRTDFYVSGSTTERTHLSASGDRSVVGIVAGNISSGPVFLYRATANTFTPEKQLSSFISDVSVDMTGSTVLVTPGAYVLDASLNLSGTVVLGSGSGGNAVDPTWGVGYRSVASRLDVMNLSTFLKTGELPLGDSVNNAASFRFVGHMDISSDGSLVAVITDNGFSLVRPWAAAPASINLVRNGGFGSGLTRWLTFGSPDPSYFVGGVTNGVFEFYRMPPPAGTSSQAVVYQETGMSLPAGAPLQADFQLGNSSSVRKRMSVLVLDSDFSDLHVCTFWLPPGLPLTTYSIRTHTTRPWLNASIYFYAATPGSNGGSYRIDNVALTYNPALPDDRTDCVDPLTPLPPGGPDEADLLVNGDFNTGDLAPWATFGTMTSQVTGGVFEFIRPNATPPAGVVLQATGQAMTPNQILTATFSLGNSSGVRKRVTAILHDSDFSDLMACTFWLPAGQPLSPYALRAYATKAWADATVSVYAASIGPDQWIQLDDVTLKRTPGAAIAGPECIEPATPVAASVRGGAPRVARRTAAADREPPALLEIAEWLDLTDAARMRLVFESWLTAPDGSGEIQISRDGRTWITHATVGSSDTWEAVSTDLSAWTGGRIAVRFVASPPRGATGAATIWRLRGVRFYRP